MNLPIRTTQKSATTQIQRRLSASEAIFVNNVRVTTVMEKLVGFIKSNQTDLVEFSCHCLSLSRGIDYALANNEKLDSEKDIPFVVIQLCEQNNAFSVQAIMMVLLISVKNACKVGWFTEEERQQIFALAKKIESTFCSPAGVSVSDSNAAIGTVMDRFYPRLKIRHILTALEVQAGYGVYTNDFHIWKNSAFPEDRIWIFVAQVDNLDTSACIISPQKANILLNGRGIERRINVSMDTGPQMPTNVTHILKYGTNLLQATGNFTGTYIIVVAFMYEMPLPNPPVLPDHEQSLPDGLESDPDLVEGPSRISLNCPISYTRIKLPVKGSLCKHRQCFDYDNFININSRRPFWRCPHCNQSASYTEIRVDQNMVKVLKEVGGDVADVIISADGSWKAVLENDERNQASGPNLDSLKETSEMRDSTEIPNALNKVVDLTSEDDIALNIDDFIEIEDIKPSLSDLCAPSQPNDTSEVNQSHTGIIDDDFWDDFPNIPGLSQSTPTTFAQPNSVAPSLSPMPVSTVDSGLPDFPSILASNPINEYGQNPAINRTMNRTPIAVQALPAQGPGIHRTQPSMVYSTPRQPVASQPNISPSPNGFHPNHPDFERQHLLSRSQERPPRVSPVPLSASPQHNFTVPRQNHIRHDYNPMHMSGQALPNGNFRPNQFGRFINSHLQRAFNPPRPNQYQHVQTGRQHIPAGPPQSQPLQSQPPQSQSPRAVPISPDPTAPDQNWRPAARMRGSLTGRDCSQFGDRIIQPTQHQSQPSRPPGVTSSAALMTYSAQLNNIINNRTADNDAAQG